MSTTHTPPSEAAASHVPSAHMPAKSTKPKALQPTEKKSSAPTKTNKPASKAPAAAESNAKPKKPKLVRDSFTIPKDEYAVIEDLKQRTAKLAQPAKKSELLRAGLKLLSQLNDAALLAATQAVPSIKTGRPKADKK